MTFLWIFNLFMNFKFLMNICSEVQILLFDANPVPSIQLVGLDKFGLETRSLATTIKFGHSNHEVAIEGIYIKGLGISKQKDSRQRK